MNEQTDTPTNPSNEPAAQHVAVMRDRLVAELVGNQVQGTFVDATFGRGGHSRCLLKKLDATSSLFVADRDPAAIATAQLLAAEDPRVHVIEDQFSNLKAQLAERGVNSVTGFMFDLGVSSPQLDDAERGFSLRFDGPLDMRMSASGETAAEWLNRAELQDIARVLRDYGEERFAKRIAQRIVKERPLYRTLELRDLVVGAVPAAAKRTGKPFDATRVFQAIRIHVNGELDELRAVLPDAFDLLSTGGRLAVLSFHSLEDRIVKRFFRQCTKPAMPPRGLPLRADQLPQPTARPIVGPVRANDVEVRDNPRSRSAVLRVIERVE